MANRRLCHHYDITSFNTIKRRWFGWKKIRFHQWNINNNGWRRRWWKMKSYKKGQKRRSLFDMCLSWLVHFKWKKKNTADFIWHWAMMHQHQQKSLFVKWSNEETLSEKLGGTFKVLSDCLAFFSRFVKYMSRWV